MGRRSSNPRGSCAETENDPHDCAGHKSLSEALNHVDLG